ncbi:acyl-coenzyme A synthetase ACSM3, mitochondrial isoform X3 [Monodelphis domestica]|uniref:acyl-coenzyme A synthetase ACSM3, mitochondrial isoform X3 n=1 Tax=Monodelphis domestica TaxID=13616 RepID=UPI0024E26ADF|nr:acyl-coenzyme A synthetase ACSM3, mitochondrial isoform X3 [Monodelphis domestica]
MNILLRTQCFQLLKISTVSVRAFHKDYRLSAAQNFSNYESIKRDFKLEVPEYFNFAKDVLDHWAKMEKVGKRPSNPAFWWINDHGEEVKWNFQELGSLSKKFANVLAESCGLQKGDRIIVVLPAIPEWWLANVACLRTGTVLIPGTIQLTEKDILYRLQASKAKCIITNDTLALTVDSIAHHCETLKYKLLVSEKPREGWGNLKEMMKHASDDHSCVMTRHNETMTIYFTSGTTGSPKMTEHTHSSYGMGLSVNGRYWLDLTPSDIMWNTSDTGWAKSAWSSVFAPWSQGACVFVHYMPRFEPVAILKTLSRFPITTFCSAPTVYRMLVLKWEPSYKFKSLKHCVSAGEPINPEVMDQWKNKTGLNIYEGYGQTETDEPSRTASAFCGDFYKTGDRGYMDEDGYFWFIARSDDVIISSGYRIGPFEVESALAEHPAVLESGVVSSPDPIRGEVVKAFVILKPDYKSYDPEKMKNELQEHVKRTTAPYKYPRKVEFVLELPKTVSGKIKRNELRKKEWEKV